MQYKNTISVAQLAKLINVHRTTLLSWLCHYSLNKYVHQDIDTQNKLDFIFVISKRSIKALKLYLSKKNKKYLSHFNTNYKL